ncbi:unnamed protein product [Ilex paraguariensis]|uniref:F-box domain-containing protein n=1 Tax=Ilex paraguariensis TaxID=185542 RepID=A0ABC8R3P8_9AQUA
MRETEGKHEKNTEIMAHKVEGRSIESLPDSILLHILSFLEMKYVVRASVVSKRWKDFCSSVPNLIFFLSKSDLLSEDRFEKFMDSVERILLLHDLPTIQKFSLRCARAEPPYNFNRLNSLLCAVTKRNVEQLDLDFFSPDFGIPDLPSVLFTCKSLVELRLHDNHDIDFPSSTYLPNLKTLEISVIDPGDNLNQRFFSGCPVLENLSIIACISKDMNVTIDIYAPKLKILKTFLSLGVRGGFADGSEVKVMIDAQILEYLMIEDNCVAWYLIKNQSSSLVTAEIDVGLDGFWEDMESDVASRLLELFKGISHVKYLGLLGATMRGIGCLDGTAPLTFHNVTYLELCAPYLPKLSVAFQSMPNLEYLAAYVENLDAKDDDLEVESVDLSEGDNQLNEVFNWMKSQVVPGCFLSKLRVIQVCIFDGKNDELQLVKYLPKNSEAFSKMTIRLSSFLSGKECHKMASSSIGASCEGLMFCNRRCRCGLRAALKVSESEHNPGRLYYNCPDSRCNFFVWLNPSSWFAPQITSEVIETRRVQEVANQLSDDIYVRLQRLEANERAIKLLLLLCMFVSCFNLLLFLVVFFRKVK